MMSGQIKLYALSMIFINELMKSPLASPLNLNINLIPAEKSGVNPFMNTVISA